MATSSLEEDHVTSLFVAFCGKTIKFKVLVGSSSSRYKVTLLGPTCTVVTCTTELCELVLLGADELEEGAGALELVDGFELLDELLGAMLELLGSLLFDELEPF